MQNITLSEANALHLVQGIDPDLLQKQNDAFLRCVAFLSNIKKTTKINHKYSSYRLKHMVENPSGYFGRFKNPDRYTGYIYEGTFILAAYSCGFRINYHKSKELTASLNISERSLKAKLLSA